MLDTNSTIRGFGDEPGLVTICIVINCIYYWSELSSSSNISNIHVLNLAKPGIKQMRKIEFNITQFSP